jgi:hypothetical protein
MTFELSRLAEPTFIAAMIGFVIGAIIFSTKK